MMWNKSLAAVFVFMMLVGTWKTAFAQPQQILIEAKWVRTPKENLAVELYEHGSGFPASKVGFCENKENCFKDPSKVVILVSPHLSTLAGIEAKGDFLKDVYGISDAKMDENGDITCKIKKYKEGISFKILSKISEESTDMIEVSYEFELDTVAKRVPPAIPAIVEIKELEDLWSPIMGMRSVGSRVIIKDGQTIILGGICKSEPSGESILPGTDEIGISKSAKGNESEDIVELFLFTVKKGTIEDLTKNVQLQTVLERLADIGNIILLTELHVSRLLQGITPKQISDAQTQTEIIDILKRHKINFQPSTKNKDIWYVLDSSKKPPVETGEIPSIEELRAQISDDVNFSQFKFINTDFEIFCETIAEITHSQITMEKVYHHINIIAGKGTTASKVIDAFESSLRLWNLYIQEIGDNQYRVGMNQ